MKKGSKWISLIRIILLLLLFGFVAYAYKNFDLEIIKAQITKNPERNGLISFLTFFITSFTFIPSSPLTVFLSVTFNPQIAIGMYCLGNICGAIVQYFIGSKLKGIDKIAQNREKLPRFLQQLPISSPVFLLVGRIIPGGTRGLSFVCGFYRVRFITFLWTTSLMFFVNAVFQVISGTGLLKLFF